MKLLDRPMWYLDSTGNPLPVLHKRKPPPGCRYWCHEGDAHWSLLAADVAVSKPKEPAAALLVGGNAR